MVTFIKQVKSVEVFLLNAPPVEALFRTPFADYSQPIRVRPFVRNSLVILPLDLLAPRQEFLGQPNRRGAVIGLLVRIDRLIEAIR